MKVPIRNYTSIPLTLFIEPYCDEHKIPAGGEAIVSLGDGEEYSLDFHPENWVTLWNEGASPAVAEVVTKEQNIVVDALAFARMWLYRFGPRGEAAAKDLDDAVARVEETGGYIRAHFAVYKAFREGYRTKAAEIDPDNAVLPEWSGSEALAGPYRAGGVGAYFNRRTQREPWLVELGEPPFDTDVARLKFEAADAMAS